jgi:hypothetical protein
MRARLQRHAYPRSDQERGDEFRVAVTADIPLALGPGNAGSTKILGPSPYWAARISGTARPTTQLDARQKGRVWLAATEHVPDNRLLQKGPSASAVEFPLDSTNRQVTMYDPKTGSTPPADLLWLAPSAIRL